jgi:predicted SAM-dependent methyltransferase
MSTSGMKNLLGIDPYLESDIYYPNGLNILKKSITDLNQSFDLIMLNHVLEHIDDQLTLLENLKKRLNPNGICMIRIPTCSSFAWQKYGSNWVQIDAPRHLFIHSLKSISIITEKAGLKIIKTKFDSEAFQFIGSEQYLNNIALNDKNSFFVNKEKSIFSNFDYIKYKKEAKALNKISKGDQIAIFLKNIKCIR